MTTPTTDSELVEAIERQLNAGHATVFLHPDKARAILPLLQQDNKACQTDQDLFDILQEGALGDEGGNGWLAKDALVHIAAFRKAIEDNRIAELEKAREQGQKEGKAAVVSWLRDKSGQRPTPKNADIATQLADAFEQSEIPGQAKGNPS